MIRVNLSYGTPSQNKLVTTIKFASVPTSAVASVPALKYNKKNWFSIEFDDASNSAQSALNVLNARHFTDGCGNNINYRMALAINGANNTTGAEYTYDGSNSSQTTKMVMEAMLQAGGDLSDHSYFHDPTGAGTGVTPLQNTQMMEDFIQRLFSYNTRTKVVPTNYAGHAQAAFDEGYLYSTSEGTFDSFSPVGQFTPLGDFSLVPTFGALRRGFTDTWSSSLSAQKAVIDTLLTKTNWFYRLGSHTIDNLTAFTQFFDYIQAQANDQLLVATTREIFEYREMKSLPMTQSLVGDTLTIEVDLTNLSDKNRWKDLSFVIATTANIQSVTTNATTSTFNNTTKLVNVFKQTFTEGTSVIETMFNNVYDVSKGLNSDGQQVADGQVIQTVPDRGTEGNKPLIKKGVVGKLGAVVYRSQLGGYEQFLNQEGIYRENDVLFTTDQPFPREVFEVFNQSNFKTFETWKNKTDYPIPSTHSAFYYTGDAGNDAGVRYRDSNDSAPVGSANSIPSAFVPINQNILFHTKYTQDGTGIKAELRINKVLQGSCYTFSDGRLLRPRMGFGATSNVANYGMAWMGHKIGSFTDSERTVIENALYEEYNIGQRVPCPLALNLTAHKSGTVYTASYNYDPYQLPEDTAKRCVRWVLLTSVGIQSGIYHTAVDGMMTWDSNAYPIPNGYSVSNVEVIVGDTSSSGNKYYVPQKSYLS